MQSKAFFENLSSLNCTILVSRPSIPDIHRLFGAASELYYISIATREQIACSILTTGKFTYDAGGVTYSADFGFESGKHLITLASGEKWDATGVKITNQIRKWRRAIAQRSGYNADLLLLGTDAADLFLSNEEVRKIFDTNNYRVGAVEMTGKIGVGGTYLGTFLGMEVYEVSQLYNNDGVDAEMFDKTKAVVIASNADSLITHVAPIYRTDGNVVAEFYVQSVEAGDKTRVEWLIESKAMPAVHEPDVLRRADALRRADGAPGPPRRAAVRAAAGAAAGGGVAGGFV